MSFLAQPRLLLRQPGLVLLGGGPGLGEGLVGKLGLFGQFSQRGLGLVLGLGGSGDFCGEIGGGGSDRRGLVGQGFGGLASLGDSGSDFLGGGFKLLRELLIWLGELFHFVEHGLDLRGFSLGGGELGGGFSGHRFLFLQLNIGLVGGLAVGGFGLRAGSGELESGRTLILRGNRGPNLGCFLLCRVDAALSFGGGRFPGLAFFVSQVQAVGKGRRIRGDFALRFSVGSRPSTNMALPRTG